MTDLEMTKVKCANCGKELTASKQIETSIIVCNPGCFYAYVEGVKSRIYEVEFCAKFDWDCLKEEPDTAT